MQGLEDHELVVAAARGDASAFAQLMRRHYPVLLAACRRMLRDPESARDAAQEATLRAMLGLDHLRDERRFSPWLIGIGLNVCRGLLSAARTPLSLQELTDSGRTGEPRAAEPEPLDQVASGELRERVRAAIAALPAGQRRAVALFYLEGLTHAEAAAELGTRPTAVKTRLHKARRSLRHSLNDTYREYIEMTDHNHVPMTVAQLRRTAPDEHGLERHIIVLEEEGGRRLPIWVGPSEATAMALVLERVELPRPFAYQFTASLLSAAGRALREVRITELTESVFYAQAILDDGAIVDARPSDALTLALVTGAPILVAPHVLERAGQQDGYEELAGSAPTDDDARVIAEEVRAANAAVMARLAGPGT